MVRDFRKNMDELKLQIKKWEVIFAIKHGRKPQKEDIKMAPENIVCLYQKYWNFKRSCSQQSATDTESASWSEKFNKSNMSSKGQKLGGSLILKVTERLKNSCEFQEPKATKFSIKKQQCSDFISLPSDVDKVEAVDTEYSYEHKQFKICNSLDTSLSVNKASILSHLADIKKAKSCIYTQSCMKNEFLKVGDLKENKERDIDLNGFEHERECLSPHPSPSRFLADQKVHYPLTSSSELCKNDDNFFVCADESLIAGKWVVNDDDIFNNIEAEGECVKIMKSKPVALCVSSLPENKCDGKKKKFYSQKDNMKDCNSDNACFVSKKRKCAALCEETSDVRMTSLKKKIASGTLNENFVSINMQKKKFSRGNHKLNIRKMKWKKWQKSRKVRESGGIKSGSTSACFRCGEIGHWARSCSVVKNFKGAENSDAIADENRTPDDCIHDQAKSPAPVLPLIASLTGVIPEPTEDVYNCMKKFGYPEFRCGQDKAIMRILCGLSTVVILPTGSGKSLCYQLPAFLYAQKQNCITLVVSPLVSLMEDQVSSLRSAVHAVCLHSGQTEEQKTKVSEAISKHKAHILLVSPEILTRGRHSLPVDLPPVAFACIDEAHCLSQWSHNFRPSYLQLCKVLKKNLAVNCVLCLTATATKSTALDILKHVGLKNEEGSVIGSTAIPSNIHISVSTEKYKDEALIQLLKISPLSNCSSIIIYCLRRDETERLASLIRTCLHTDEPPTEHTVKRKHLVWNAEAYHAGLTPAKRRSLQKFFMSGKLRILVATTAFGMGLDKSDVRAIIHYNMPKSFESYVQEIGRSGRDGQASFCHLFLDETGRDVYELKRYIYSNGVDRFTIKKLLEKIFICSQSSKNVCSTLDGTFSEKYKDMEIENFRDGHFYQEMAFSIKDTVQSLDLKEESILTLLCYMELHTKQWLELLPHTYSTCVIHCYGGRDQMKSLLKEFPPLAVAMSMDKQEGKMWNEGVYYKFNIVKVASYMGWDSSILKKELKKLQWKDKKKSGVVIEFSDLSFHVFARSDLTDEEFDEILNFLHDKSSKQEKSELLNLEMLYEIFKRYSFPDFQSCYGQVGSNEIQNTSIKEAIKAYFEAERPAEMENFNTSALTEVEALGIPEEYDYEIRQLIRDMIFAHPDEHFSGRAIARILQGISSPCYPAEIWGRSKRYWRRYLDLDFNEIAKIANEELRKMK